ncbi:hypothetical protein O6V51_12470 [Salmonella enterica subsp. enterica]
MIDVIDQLVLLIAKRLGIKTGHVKLCIVLQGLSLILISYAAEGFRWRGGEGGWVGGGWGGGGGGWGVGGVN